jgi:hypothetical protein
LSRTHLADKDRVRHKTKPPLKVFDVVPARETIPRACRLRKSRGLRLYYERAGSGDLELVFVPGWSLLWISDHMCATPLPVAAAVIRSLNDWNGVGALALEPPFAHFR